MKITKSLISAISIGLISYSSLYSEPKRIVERQNDNMGYSCYEQYKRILSTNNTNEKERLNQFYKKYCGERINQIGMRNYEK